MQVVIDARAANSAAEPPQQYTEILAQGKAGAWILNLPPELRVHQHEIEALLTRVFDGKRSEENFQLAQQMTINWCLSKYRKMGLSPHDTEWL